MYLVSYVVKKRKIAQEFKVNYGRCLSYMQTEHLHCMIMIIDLPKILFTFNKRKRRDLTNDHKLAVSGLPKTQTNRGFVSSETQELLRRN